MEAANGDPSCLSCFRPADQEEPSVLPLLCAGFSRVCPTTRHSSHLCLYQTQLVIIACYWHSKSLKVTAWCQFWEDFFCCLFIWWWWNDVGKQLATEWILVQFSHLFFFSSKHHSTLSRPPEVCGEQWRGSLLQWAHPDRTWRGALPVQTQVRRGNLKNTSALT